MGEGKPLLAREMIGRKPVRITVTISWLTHQRLIEKSKLDGRSLSNLVAYLLDESTIL